MFRIAWGLWDGKKGERDIVGGKKMLPMFSQRQRGGLSYFLIESLITARVTLNKIQNTLNKQRIWGLEVAERIPSSLSSIRGSLPHVLCGMCVCESMH